METYLPQVLWLRCMPHPRGVRLPLDQFVALLDQTEERIERFEQITQGRTYAPRHLCCEEAYQDVVEERGCRTRPRRHHRNKRACSGLGRPTPRRARDIRRGEDDRLRNLATTLAGPLTTRED